MDEPNAQVVDPTEGPNSIQLRKFEEDDFNKPDHLLEETRDYRAKYLKLCVPLYKYTLKGNWEKVKPMLLDHSRMLLNAAIAKGETTVLHVAAGTSHFHFVKELVKLMEESNIGLDLRDKNGNTAFALAAVAGNMETVKLMLEKDPSLPKTRGKNGFTPILFAALQGRADMANYLYPFTNDETFEEVYWNKLFLACVDTDIYDLALRMLNDRPGLAFARYEDGVTGLHIMSQKMTDLDHLSLKRQNQLICSGMKHGIALQLVDSLWLKILDPENSEEDIREVIDKPSGLLFGATEVGNLDFLAVLMRSYPDLAWELDDKKQSILHIAVLRRHPKIFNLIRDMCANKDIILSEVNNDRNNILHLAAKLAPADRLELVPGAAFQMKFELLWFEEVRKMVSPSDVKMKNSKNKTPHDLFTEEHKSLRKDAESWMKRKANSCLIVSTLIATAVFSAAFSIPGGFNGDSKTPHYLRKPSFMIFAISDAIAMISSSASTLAFLSILISRYAEYDFYKSLPSKLIFGLIALFVSITSMMIAFSCAFFVAYEHGLKWVPSFISLLSFLPIVIFFFSQFQLFYDIIYSTYYLS